MDKRITFLIIVIYLFSPVGLSLYLLNQMPHVKIKKSNEALGITVQAVNESLEGDLHNERKHSATSPNVMNIALFGLDRYGPGEDARSDAIMIFTVDFQNKKLKLSSIMRDLRVPIDNHGDDKINHAYSYGGPQLTIKTINQNFGTNIRDFIAVDMKNMEKVIDILGGVNINVKDYEVPQVNVKKRGLQLLNGKQAVAYARIRYAGNGDFERTERQRRILKQLLIKIKKQEKSELPIYIAKILPYFETSMDKATILSLVMKCMSKGVNTLEQERFPIDGYWKSVHISDIYYLETDLEGTQKRLTDFIFNDLKTPPIL